jgi:CHAD domain-containing protein
MSVERATEFPVPSEPRHVEIEVPDVDEGATVADAVRRAVATSVVRLVEHDAGVRLGEDAEDVHQARIATRRLRSDLRTLADALEPSWAPPLREELRWLGGMLGAVRDAEVLRDRLRSREARLAPRDRPTAERLVGILEDRRDDARRRLLASMSEARYADLLAALIEAARAPGILDELASAPAATALRPALAVLWKDLEGAIDRVVEEASDDSLHAARIRAKRVRYAAEAVAPVFGKGARRFARAANALQDVLGEHQDAVLAAAWLREAAEATPAAAFVAGELAALEAEAARAARAAWPKAWKRLSRKRLRFWA